MSCNEIHVGDKGTEFRATIKDSGTALNVSAATVSFIFRKPDRTVFSAATSFVTGGTDGAVYFITPTTTTLDIAGKWNLQARVQVGVEIFRSDVYDFKVWKNLE